MFHSLAACAGCRNWMIRRLDTYRPGNSEGGDIHCDVGGIRLDAADAGTVTSGTACAQDRSIVRTQDERVPIGVGQVLRQGSRLVDVVPKEQ